MKIECTIKRKGGTKVTIEGRKYHFRPDEDNRHVENVEHKPDIDRFLGIPEAYRPLNQDHAGSPAGDGGSHLEPSGDEELKGSAVHPDTIEIDGAELDLSDVVASAFDQSEMSVEEWNALSDDDRHARIDDYLDSLAGEEGDEEDGEETEEERLERLERLRAEYREAFGKQPHGQMKAETIEKKLKEGKA